MILALLTDATPVLDRRSPLSDAQAGLRPAAPFALTVAIAEASLGFGDTATASASVEGFPAPTLAYQWTLDGADVAGETGPVFAGVPVGALRVRVTATNSEGVAGPVTSAPVTVAALAPGAFSAVQWAVEATGVSGEVAITLFGLPPGNGAPLVGVERQVDGGPWVALPGVDLDAPYTIGGLANDQLYSFTLRAVNGAGAGSTSDVKTATPAIAAAAPFALTVAIAEASLGFGDTATASASVEGFPAPTLAYQWTLDGADVAGETGPVFAGVPVGALRVRVTATNSEGVAGPVTSAPVTVAALAPDAFSAGQWSADATGVSGEVAITLFGLPPGNGAPLVGVERQVDGGPWADFAALSSVAPSEDLALAKAWTSTAAAQDWSTTSSVAPFVIYQSPWGAWDMAPGDVFNTELRADQTISPAWPALRTITGPLQFGSGLPKGAPMVILGAHFDLTSSPNPFTTDGLRGIRSDAITEWTAATRVRDRSAPDASLNVAIQTYATVAPTQVFGWADQNTEQWFDIQVRHWWPNFPAPSETKFRGQVTLGGVEYRIYRNPTEGTVRPGSGTIGYGVIPTRQTLLAQHDMKAIIDWIVADHNAVTAQSLPGLYIYQCATWIEPRSGVIDATTEGFEVRFNGVTYGRLNRTEGGVTLNTPYTVSGLTDNQIYAFRLRAVNASGAGPGSEADMEAPFAPALPEMLGDNEWTLQPVSASTDLELSVGRPVTDETALVLEIDGAVKPDATFAALASGPVAVDPPTIAGLLTVGETLTASDGRWISNSGVTGSTWRWLRNGAPISGATASSYTLTLSDAGASITVEQTATDGQGSAASVSAPVSPTPDALASPKGFGQSATGGIDKTIYSVTSTSASAADAGSLPWAIAQAKIAGGGYILIDAEGPLKLTDWLVVDAPNVTIDARRQPGLGFWLSGSGLHVNANNVIVRHLRIYPGSNFIGTIARERDCIRVDHSVSVETVYFDRCDAMFSTDEAVTVFPWIAGSFAQNVTFDGMLVAESLHESIHFDESDGKVDNHGKGILFSAFANRITFINGLITSNHDRSPRTLAGSVEFISNVIANFGLAAPQVANDSIANQMFGVAEADFINNFWMKGPVEPRLSDNGRSTKKINLLQADYENPAGHNLTDMVYTSGDYSGAWTLAGGFNDAAMDDRWSFLDNNTTFVPASYLENAAMFPKSGAASGALTYDQAFLSLNARVGALNVNGERHPFAARVVNYITEDVPFSTGWHGNLTAGSAGAFVPDELRAVGATISSPGAGALTVTLPAANAALPPVAGRVWTGVSVTVLNAYTGAFTAGAVPPARTALDWPDGVTLSGSLDGGAVAFTGLPAGFYVARVTYTAGGVPVEVYSGRPVAVTGV